MFSSWVTAASLTTCEPSATWLFSTSATLPRAASFFSLSGSSLLARLTTESVIALSRVSSAHRCADLVQVLQRAAVEQALHHVAVLQLGLHGLDAGDAVAKARVRERRGGLQCGFRVDLRRAFQAADGGLRERGRRRNLGRGQQPGDHRCRRRRGRGPQRVVAIEQAKAAQAIQEGPVVRRLVDRDGHRCPGQVAAIAQVAPAHVPQQIGLAQRLAPRRADRVFRIRGRRAGLARRGQAWEQQAAQGVQGLVFGEQVGRGSRQRTAERTDLGLQRYASGSAAQGSAPPRRWSPAHRR